MGLLGAKKLGLRLRIEDGARKFTLKGPSQSTAGLFQRSELEVAADPNGWLAVLEALEQAGVRLTTSARTTPDAASWLRESGLRPTLERSTAREVLFADQNGPPLVELALDTTTYYLGIYEVVFREVEAESLSDEAKHVQALGAALLEAFPGRVEPSTQGKYSRGLMLAERLASGS